jgi:hypothetical protein
VGHGFFGGSKPLKCRHEALKSFVRKHRSGAQVVNGHGQSPRRRKALESETQERWKLKEAFKKAVSESREEGSQTLNAELLKGRVKPL